MTSPGLPAAAYAKLVDVDPPIADHVLELLTRASIPAYAEPLVGETGPYRDVRAPDRPTTRIYVERTRLTEARNAISASLPTLRAEFQADAAARVDADDMRRASSEQIDAAWDDLVAGFHTAEPPPRPDAEAHPPTGDEGGSGLSSRLVREHTLPPEPAAPSTAGPRDYAVSDMDDDEGFTPPTPPPLPRPRDRFDSLAWAGVIGGPIAIIVAFALGIGGWLAAAGFVAFTAGFVTLVARTSDRRDDGDGAVV
jgi:hypothetical protein